MPPWDGVPRGPRSGRATYAAFPIRSWAAREGYVAFAAASIRTAKLTDTGVSATGVLQTLDLRTKEAADSNPRHPESFFRLCTDEVERRESKQLGLRLRRASFESAK